MTGFGDVRRVAVRRVLRRERNALEWTFLARADQRRSRALSRAGQKGALAEIGARVEKDHRLPGEPPEADDGR